MTPQIRQNRYGIVQIQAAVHTVTSQKVGRTTVSAAAIPIAAACRMVRRFFTVPGYRLPSSRSTIPGSRAVTVMKIR